MITDKVQVTEPEIILERNCIVDYQISHEYSSVLIMAREDFEGLAESFGVRLRPGKKSFDRGGWHWILL